MTLRNAPAASHSGARRAYVARSMHHIAANMVVILHCRGGYTVTLLMARGVNASARHRTKAVGAPRCRRSMPNTSATSRM